MVVIEVYRRGSASTKKVASFWAFLYIWGYDGRSSFHKTFFFGGRVYIFSCDSSSGAPHEAHICKGHSESVGAGAPCSVCRPPGASRKFRYYREPHFVCGNMYSLNIPCWKNMIGAMSCSVCTVHLYSV